MWMYSHITCNCIETLLNLSWKVDDTDNLTKLFYHYYNARGRYVTLALEQVELTKVIKIYDGVRSDIINRESDKHGSGGKTVFNLSIDRM